MGEFIIGFLEEISEGLDIIFWVLIVLEFLGLVSIGFSKFLIFIFAKAVFTSVVNVISIEST